jgi:hypothetical protein
MHAVPTPSLDASSPEPGKSQKGNRGSLDGHWLLNKARSKAYTFDNNHSLPDLNSIHDLTVRGTLETDNFSPSRWARYAALGPTQPRSTLAEALSAERKQQEPAAGTGVDTGDSEHALPGQSLINASKESSRPDITDKPLVMVRDRTRPVAIKSEVIEPHDHETDPGPPLKRKKKIPDESSFFLENCASLHLDKLFDCDGVFEVADSETGYTGSPTNQNPFECPQCTGCFARRDLLFFHQQRLHQTGAASMHHENRRGESTSEVQTSPSAPVCKNSIASSVGSGHMELAKMEARPEATALEKKTNAHADEARPSNCARPFDEVIKESSVYQRAIGHNSSRLSSAELSLGDGEIIAHAGSEFSYSVAATSDDNSSYTSEYSDQGWKESVDPENIHGLALSVLDDLKNDMISRVMEQLYNLLDTEGISHETTQGGSPTSHHSGSTALRSNGRSSQNKGKRRINDRDGDGTGDENDDDPSKRPRQWNEHSKSSRPVQPRKLACPFYKHDCLKHQRWPSCAGPGWKDVHRMK